jgi:hypothetical protein
VSEHSAAPSWNVFHRLKNIFGRTGTSPLLLTASVLVSAESSHLGLSQIGKWGGGGLKKRSKEMSVKVAFLIASKIAYTMQKASYPNSAKRTERDVVGDAIIFIIIICICISTIRSKTTWPNSISLH